MFKFLNDCLVQTLNEEDLKEAHRKFDGSTILHAAIAAEHFGVEISFRLLAISI